MSYVTENTIWLSREISVEIKKLVTRYFELADSNKSDAAYLMKTGVFSNDAVLIGPNGTYIGSEDISKSREKAWNTVVARKHVVSRVFFGQSETAELVLLGSAQMEFVNGNKVEFPFASHLKLKPGTQAPRINFMEVYTDSKPAAAVQK